MDYEFPQQLFPSLYNCGPPDSVLKHCAGKWGGYDLVRPQGSSGPVSSWTFTSRHQARGETWRHTEPIPVPLLPPKNAHLWPSQPPDPLDFTEHMQNFFMDHSLDAFGCMSKTLGENFNFEDGKMKSYQKDSVHMWKVKNFLNKLKYKICQRSYFSSSLDGYSALLSDAVPSVPPDLLASLLHEELTEQRDRLLFSEAATGGALAFIPSSQSGGDGSSQHGCLIYPGNQGLDRLNFHNVALQHHGGRFSILNGSGGGGPSSFQLSGPVRQISSASLFNNHCVAVRSDRLCGVWSASEGREPRLLQAVNTREVATCVSVSPHIAGEVLVASESGAVNLWTVGRGTQKVREEDGNLYFNAKSPWRWCDFSAHPRVVLYVDRTGAELTDIRASPVSSHTLFRISSTSECRSGERLILSRYLGDVHPFHHLVITQYSAYIMDERFPCMPMLKWDHMMQSPPVFCHVVPGPASSGSAAGGARTTKVLLGSHGSQEITMLQYSGGSVEACSSRGPPWALLRPRDSLKHLPVQIPHRLDIATDRLSSPATGLTCIQKNGGKEAGGEECICVLQLTETGDIFYQILEPEQQDADASRPPAAEEEPPPARAAAELPRPTPNKCTTLRRRAAEELTAGSSLLIPNTSSDEDVIGPTQGAVAPRFVAETPEREQQAEAMFSDSEDSAFDGKDRWLQVGVNDSETEDGDKAKDGGVKETALSLVGQTRVKLSDGARVTWKHWLQKAIRKRGGKNPESAGPQHCSVTTRGLLRPPEGGAGDPTEEERVRGLRRDLRACMSKHSLLVRGAVAASSLGALDAVPLPTLVDTEAWRDPLSQRLTLSWRGGEGAWRAWWEEHLGLNREEKMEALRRKRKRAKEARRAAGRRLELSGSFTSSISYQSDLDSFSDSAGWSSASQGAWSDTDGPEGGTPRAATPRAATPSTIQNDTPATTPTATPQSVKAKHGEQQTPSSSCSRALLQTVKPDSTPAGLRRIKRQADNYLSSLLAPQDESSHHSTYFPEEPGGASAPPPPAAPSAQPRSSHSVPLRSLRVDLSQDSSIWSGFSMSQTLSQSSQGQPGLSQASQASQPKKKSRMGF